MQKKNHWKTGRHCSPEALTIEAKYSLWSTVTPHVSLIISAHLKKQIKKVQFP